MYGFLYYIIISQCFGVNTRRLSTGRCCGWTVGWWCCCCVRIIVILFSLICPIIRTYFLFILDVRRQNWILSSLSSSLNSTQHFEFSFLYGRLKFKILRHSEIIYHSNFRFSLQRYEKFFFFANFWKISSVLDKFAWYLSINNM